MTDTSMMHQWIYVIIPVSRGQSNRTEESFPLFCAYCKNCQAYFTDPLPYSRNGPSGAKSKMPKFGCVPPPPFGAVDPGLIS